MNKQYRFIAISLAISILGMMMASCAGTDAPVTATETATSKEAESGMPTPSPVETPIPESIHTLEHPTYKIYFIAMDNVSSYWTDVDRGANDAAKKTNNVLYYLYPSPLKKSR